MKRNDWLSIASGLWALAGITGCVLPLEPTPPSSAALSDGGVATDLAGPARKCKDFASFPGTEIYCWDFTQEATRQAVIMWAANQTDVVAKNCWSSPGSALVGGANSSIPQGVDCQLPLTGQYGSATPPSVLNKGLDLSAYSSVTVMVKYQVTGFGGVMKPPLTLLLSPGAQPEMAVGNIYATPSEFLPYGVSFSIPAGQKNNYVSAGLNLPFSKPTAGASIAMESIAVLGVPR